MSRMKDKVVEMMDAAERWGRERSGMTDSELWAKARDMAGPDLMDPEPGGWLFEQLFEAYHRGVMQAESEGLYQRLESAIEKAREAFFDALVKAYPELTSGDLDPLATFQFEIASEQVARSWLTANLPLRG